MSHFVNTEPCPKCRSKGNDVSGDNLTRWSDNHAHCFACGYYEPGDIVAKHFSKKVITNSKGLIYPEVTSFSQECLDYLKQFGLTNEEIYSNLNGHEDGYSFFDSSLFVVRRLHKKPKVITHGDVVGNEPIFACPNGSDTIVLVEDLISAIKVSRLIDSCALLKTAIHDILLYRLSSRYDNCWLWLDPDMYKHMVEKLLPRIKPYFNEVKIIMSEKDPKFYTTKELKEFIG